MPTSTTPAQPAQPAEEAGAPTVARIRPKDWSSEHETYNLLAEDNWQSWRDDILLTLRICGLGDYVNGTIKCPDVATDPVGADNWEYNDTYTKKVIRDRLSQGQKFYTSNCETAEEMWSNLKAIHQPCSDQTENRLMRELTEMKAKDGDNIIEHLAKFKQLWDHITVICQADLPLSPELFKWFLVYSLPASWDEFTTQFSRDPAKQNITIHELIGECNKEYRRRQKRDREQGTDNQSTCATTKSALANLIGKQAPNQKANAPRLKCTHCDRNNHKTEDCYYSSKPKCTNCNRLGHKKDQCRFKKKSKKLRKQKEKLVADALS